MINKKEQMMLDFSANHFATFSIAKALAEFDITIDNIETKHLVNDSRFVEPGDIFAAVTGTLSAGNEYINSAVAKGACLVIAQCQNSSEHGTLNSVTEQGNTATVVNFFEFDKQLSLVSAYYYDKPFKNMSLIGVTGTNGKTSCCQLLAQLFTKNNHKSAIIGTLGAGTLDSLEKINNTTPGPTKLQQLLAKFSFNKIENVAMEVSSHALSQNRVDANMVDIAVFTNLSRDHLDYHGDMGTYADVKKRLFLGSAEQVLVLNVDDQYCQSWLGELPDENRQVMYSVNEANKHLLENNEFLLATNIVCHNQGVSFKLTSSWGNCEINSALLGEFNVANLLAAMAVLLVKGIELTDITKCTEHLVPVTGRMETYGATGKATAVVDYAHTPDGLEKALESAKAHCQGELWLVFGCGGDRDKGKRPMMGSIAEQYADHIVLTNDNPRSEEPSQIAADIKQGIKAINKVDVIIDRQQAVISALSRAKENDMVLCAGKGHEDYLIIGDETIAYHEREVVRQFYQGRAKS
ncbi:UDP-N-acetylmuramoyl-L-alanyl-D-glutamate--2,6-diaminopimelate ligase [Thalassotalea psychrophila]|uniref:UDP-N-acetylmuramoyl-L-alanyl-D-glutamate--2,6-diaminopimelate ligase n=1 Tax=Thalassotalea psychrophila TaxID=3065647 RepID=A0ABY9TYT6_9GAMM|nr:UDP-N-acetylmuramoyl-L-alanyl-D-glutamate--2,6-diaminopimelate ligase [Colwelliaceae bacterium SQ149]